MGACSGIDRFAPDEFVDLSDQPVLDARTRLLLAPQPGPGVPTGGGVRLECPPAPAGRKRRSR